MAITNATESLSSSNMGESLGEISLYTELQTDLQIETNNLLTRIDDTLFVIYESMNELFSEMFDRDDMERLRSKDTDDNDNRPEPTRDDNKEDPFSLFDFFKGLAAQLVRFVGVILPAIIATLGLANLGFTGKEGEMLKGIKAFFTKDWWVNKGKLISNWFKNNRAVVAIKEFFGEGGKGGKFGQYMDDALKSFRAFFSLEGEGLIAKTFRGIRGFGGKIAAVMGKIFYPISLLMSAFDGFMNAKEDYKENESLVSAGIQFVSGFVASFIGTFMDLIKDGIMWVIGKLPFVEVDENGEFTNSILKFIDDMDFTQAFLDLGDIFSNLFLSAIQGITEWWENFSLWDALTGGMSNDGIMESVAASRGNGARAAAQDQLSDEVEKRSEGGNGVNIVDASTNSSTTNASNSQVTVGAQPSAGNPGGARKRRRGA